MRYRTGLDQNTVISSGPRRDSLRRGHDLRTLGVQDIDQIRRRWVEA